MKSQNHLDIMDSLLVVVLLVNFFLFVRNDKALMTFFSFFGPRQVGLAFLSSWNSLSDPPLTQHPFCPRNTTMINNSTNWIGYNIVLQSIFQTYTSWSSYPFDSCYQLHNLHIMVSVDIHIYSFEVILSILARLRQMVQTVTQVSLHSNGSLSLQSFVTSRFWISRTLSCISVLVAATIAVYLWCMVLATGVHCW